MKIMKIIEMARERESAGDLSEDFILEHGLADEGVSDWTPSANAWCGDGHAGWECTRHEGHTGPHVAGNSETIRASWWPKPTRPDTAIEWARSCSHGSYGSVLAAWIDHLEREAAE